MLASVLCLETPSGCSLEALFVGCLSVLVAETYQNTVGEVTSGIDGMKSMERQGKHACQMVQVLRHKEDNS